VIVRQDDGLAKGLLEGEDGGDDALLLREGLRDGDGLGPCRGSLSSPPARLAAAPVASEPAHGACEPRAQPARASRIALQGQHERVLGHVLGGTGVSHQLAGQATHEVLVHE